MCAAIPSGCHLDLPSLADLELVNRAVISGGARPCCSDRASRRRAETPLVPIGHRPRRSRQGRVRLSPAPPTMFLAATQNQRGRPPARTTLRYPQVKKVCPKKGSGVSPRPIMIRAKTPLSLQRFQRLYRVLAGPYSLGASHHRKPLRLMKIMPLNTLRSSTRGLPWLLGKNGGSRSICASVTRRDCSSWPPVDRGPRITPAGAAQADQRS